MNNQSIKSQCEGKKIFTTFSAADKNAKNLRRNREHIVHAYKCDVCQKFHVGSISKKYQEENQKLKIFKKNKKERIINEFE